MGLERILPNVKNLLRRRPDARLRIPVVPGFNTGEAIFAGFAEFAAGLAAAVELLPCHRLGEGKYLLLGKAFPGEGIKTEAAAAEAERLAALLRDRGVAASVSGSLGGGGVERRDRL
jgi:pyruvate-formate lyase-activating enzyme